MKSWIVLAALAAPALCLPAQAADVLPTKTPPPAQADSGWRLQITPYAWAASMKGKIQPTGPLLGGQIAPPTILVDKPFRDILRDLDGALSLHGTLRRDRFVLFGDLMWTRVSAGRHSGLLGGLLPVAADARVTQASATVLAGYTLVQEPAFNLDVMAGARAGHIKASASASAVFPVVGPVNLSLDRTASWVDPVVAATMQVDLAPAWSVTLYGDYGGFGVGSQSTWQLLGTLSYRVRENFLLSAGYRHLSFDYRKGGGFLDLDMSGPILGATWRF